MFNKLHNGNTEALPLIRKEKTIAVVILAFVFDQTVDAATVLPCAEIRGQAVQLFCEIVVYRLKSTMFLVT